MNMYTNSKKSKKLILILTFFVLFNLICPKKVIAIPDWDEIVAEIVAAPAKIFWTLEAGLYKMVNNWFTNDANDAGSVGGVYLTPENIIKGEFLIFDADIFKEITNDNNYKDYGGNVTSGKIRLRELVAGWYYALRNFAIVALLSVLVYVGIRMIMSTIAQDKAKYKTMFKDWLVALCLLILMHYIMITILHMTSVVVDAIGSGQGADLVSTLSADISNILKGAPYTHDGMDISDAYAKIVVFAGVMLYTFIFAIKYLKREFTIIFLILLGPISCITYPIDKISDGKAQAYNRWFSEFLYQVIIQPFHLLLYIVLIGTSIELAEANIIYALVCFAVMIPAEKFVKEMFGFKDKLGSPLGAMALGAMGSKALDKIKGGGSSSGNKFQNDNSSTPHQLPPNTVDDKNIGVENNNPIDQNPDQNALGPGEDMQNPDQNALSPGEDMQNLDQNQLGQEGLGEDASVALNAGGAAALAATSANQQYFESRDTNDSADMEYQNQQKLDQINEKIGNKEDKSQGLIERARSIHGQRMLKKWGTTSRAQRWVKRGKKLVGGTLKTAVKAGTTIGGAVALGALGMMVGQGAKGALAGATIGGSLGNKMINGVTDVGSDYISGMRNDGQREVQALKDFKGDNKQIDKAVMSYRQREGKDPLGKELEQELEDRFALSRFGLSDNQVDDSIDRYKQLKESGNMTQEQALNRTALEAQLKDRYKGKFEKESDMKAALASLTERLGGNEQLATDVLFGASKMAREPIQLPKNSRQETVQIPSRNFATAMLTARGNNKPTEQQIKQEEEIYFRLQDNGFDENQIRQLNNLSLNSGEDFNVVVDRALEIRGEWQKGKAPDIDRLIGKDAGTHEANQEIIERMEIKTAFDIKGNNSENKITAIRQFEKENNINKNQRQLAEKAMNRELSNNDRNSMTDKDKDIVEQYEKLSNTSKVEVKRISNKNSK